MPVRSALALALVLLAVPSASAQAALQVGRSVEADLPAGGSHAYTLALDADRFVAGEADQQTVDVVITVTGPDGAAIGRFDGPARGADPFQFEAEAAGDYTITVTPFEDGAGRYALRVDRAEPLATTPEGTVRQLMAVHDRDGAPGGVLAVVRGGEVVYEEAFGTANLTHGVPFTTDTRTNIGSTSKQFTAYAIGLLAERGELGLDDDVREHLPELPDLGETVTLRHLLTHTSGYREFLNTLVVAGRPIDRGDPVTRDEIVRIVQRQPALQNRPGAEWNYNNSGFALLTLVVERVTGQPFPEWMGENVFGPLGMDHTVVRASPSQVVPNSAQGYTRGEGGVWQETPDLGGAMGAGGIYTTAGDLARWMTRVHLGDAAPDVIEQMTTRAVLASGDTTDYGLGLFVDEVGGRRRVHHGGADNAHRAMFEVFPEIGAGVLVLTNSPADATALAAETARAFFGDAFEEEAEEATEPADDVAADPAAFDPETFEAFAGRYALDAAPAFVMAFRRDGDRYLIQPTGQPETEIVPTSDSTFASVVVDARVTFHRDADGVARALTLHQGGDHRAARVDAVVAEAVDLSDYEGRYFSEELEVFYTLVAEDGALVLRHLRTGDQPLAHVRGDTFSLSGPTIAFERDAAGRVEAFTVDFVRARGLRFERVER